MSFLNDVRLVFAGNFQADVSTVNNDVRHFDNAGFQADFQKFQDPAAANGWWNPTGSGAFRLLGCRVTGAGAADGSMAVTPEDDAAVGLSIAGSDTRSSGKLVDLDPTWQMASAPWGLEVRLADRNQPAYFSAPYKPHAFRDLWFGRLLDPTGTPVPGDGGAAATFQSILSGVAWASDLKGSRVLEQLKERSAATGALSIRLTTYAYRDAVSKDGFTLGRVVGVIGPHLAGEPESFILGRRFAPTTQQSIGNGSTLAGCSFFSASVDRTAGKLFLDLSNGLRLAQIKDMTDPAKNALSVVVNDIGPLNIGILRDADTTENTAVGDANFLRVGVLNDYDRQGWLETTGGVVALPLSEAASALVDTHPLALAALSRPEIVEDPGNTYGSVAIRETLGGFFLEAEPIVHRIEAPGSSTATLFAACYGAPIAAQLTLAQVNQSEQQAATPDIPGVPTPSFGLPTTALQIPQGIQTDTDGRASLTVSGPDPGNPRGYIDGQIYAVDFNLPGPDDPPRNPFDFIVVHVRDAVASNPDPGWDDIAPILLQYANLYPIMSQGLFDISDRELVRQHARTLHLAFSMPMEDPNHMPVTRDLSEGKRALILAYLKTVMAEPDSAPALQVAVAADPRPTDRPRTQPPTNFEGEALSGKTAAARSFAARKSQSGLA